VIDRASRRRVRLSHHDRQILQDFCGIWVHSVFHSTSFRRNGATVGQGGEQLCASIACVLRRSDAFVCRTSLANSSGFLRLLGLFGISTLLAAWAGMAGVRLDRAGLVIRACAQHLPASGPRRRLPDWPIGHPDRFSRHPTDFGPRCVIRGHQDRHARAATAAPAVTNPPGLWQDAREQYIRL